MIIHFIHIVKCPSFRVIFLPKLHNPIIQGLIKNPEIKVERNLKCLRRKKVSRNSRKKIASLKCYQNRVLAKRERILEIRKQKIAKYRINYMPLCTEEDLMRLESQKKPNSEEN
jgi:hypothetical protein